uniref:U6 snRNA-associated Sm-like protein LSm4 n=1 Tax=Cucumis melo TaxID=3656 RepID=A0A9I9DW17_CUCME
MEMNPTQNGPPMHSNVLGMRQCILAMREGHVRLILASKNSDRGGWSSSVCFVSLKMLPLSLLKTAQGHPMLVELKNGETYNGHLVNCDTWMNIHLREVICTSKDGDRFWRMPEFYIRGNTIKYLRVPDEGSLIKLKLVVFGEIWGERGEVEDEARASWRATRNRKPLGVGRGRGRGREDGPGGRSAKGMGRGFDDGAKAASGGRGKGGPGGKPGAIRALTSKLTWSSWRQGTGLIRLISVTDEMD